MQSDSVPRPSRKGIARRQEVLDRAIEVFATKGAERTSLRAIAESIGVSHAALLHYFSSREALLLEVLRENDSRRIETDTTEPTDAIVGLMIASAHRNVSVPGLVALYSTMLGSSLESGNALSREYFASRFERIRAELVERIEEGQTAGTIRGGVPAKDMAALVVAASDGLQIQWLLDDDVDIASGLALLGRILEP
jgi:TetR/AcrR family transcriptional regulator, transcriptional repressor of aconitase